MRESGLGRRVVVGVFILQFLIPLVALVGSPAPTRLGFQMYSGPGKVSVQAIAADGDREDIDVDDLVAAARPDIDWVSNLPAAKLCGARREAVAVVVSQGNRTVRHSCGTT